MVAGVELFLGGSHVSKGAAGEVGRGILGDTLGTETIRFELDVGLDLVRKVAVRTAAEDHRGAPPSASRTLKIAVARRRQRLVS